MKSKKRVKRQSDLKPEERDKNFNSNLLRLIHRSTDMFTVGVFLV